jgi:hypothetical protein
MGVSRMHVCLPVSMVLIVSMVRLSDHSSVDNGRDVLPQRLGMGVMRLHRGIEG